MILLLFLLVTLLSIHVAGMHLAPPFLLINLIGASFAGYFFPRMNKLVVESKEGKRFIGFFFWYGAY